MPQQAEVITMSTAGIEAGHQQPRAHGFGPGMHVDTEQAGVHSGKQISDAEAIIGELVSQYLRCSTNQSGVFRCW